MHEMFFCNCGQRSDQLLKQKVLCAVYAPLIATFISPCSLELSSWWHDIARSKYFAQPEMSFSFACPKRTFFFKIYFRKSSAKCEFSNAFWKAGPGIFCAANIDPEWKKRWLCRWAGNDGDTAWCRLRNASSLGKIYGRHSALKKKKENFPKSTIRF